MVHFWSTRNLTDLFDSASRKSEDFEAKSVRYLYFCLVQRMKKTQPVHTHSGLQQFRTKYQVIPRTYFGTKCAIKAHFFSCIV